MIRDFTPARAVTDAGIIIKPHLLDRSKFKSPEITWTQPEYSGSIDTAFISGSHGSAFDSVGFDSIDGESSTRYTRAVNTPVGKRQKVLNNHISTPGEPLQIEKNFEENNKSLDIEYFDMETLYKTKEDYTDNEIEVFIDENKDQLKREYIDFKYVILNPKNLIGIEEFN